MKFWCLLPIRDEADILRQCLEKLLSWADGIFVFDTGSVDESWELILEIASKEKRIIPIGKDPVYYSEPAVRGYMFQKARSWMNDGDWFLRVDADEFHYINPPDFVRFYMKKEETLAYHQYYNFELTTEEAEQLAQTNLIQQERRLPIDLRRKYYTISNYSEPRLCRYRSSMHWPLHASFPKFAGFVAKERLPILHFPNRDPQQMQRRCKIRYHMLADPENKQHWSNEDIHWTISDWRKFLVPKEDGRLHYRPAYSSIELVSNSSHLAPFYKRAAQRILHRFFLPILDKIGSDPVPPPYPKKLSAELVQLLNQELKD